MLDTVMPMHEGRELPRFYLRQIDLPELAGWEVGAKRYLIVKVEMTGKNNRKDMIAPESDREKIEGVFQVLSVRSLGKEPVDAVSLEKKEFQRVVADVKSGKLR